MTGSDRLATAPVHGTERSEGRLGAVLRLAGKSEPIALGKYGPWITTTQAQARTVLTDTEHFDFVSDVSREKVDRSRPATSASRSRHLINASLDANRVARGRDVFVREWADAVSQVRGSVFDAMEILRRPVARSTTAAVLPEANSQQVDEIGQATLAWIDALGPVIASRFGASRWSPRRRREAAARRQLEAILAPLHVDPPVLATMLAAGIQVPIAAGAWLLVELAVNPEVRRQVSDDPKLGLGVVWETLRLCPPTWITPRVTAEEVTLQGHKIEQGMVVLVSPLLLGRSSELVPGPESGAAALDEFAPSRWDGNVRPGAWLPFGAGPHSCPGRNLGLAQLAVLADWGARVDLRTLQTVTVNQTRGIFPEHAVLRVTGESDAVGGL